MDEQQQSSPFERADDPSDNQSGAPTHTAVKRLYRSDDKKLLLGVCGGLAEYFDIDPNIVRAAFAVLALFGGSGILLYLVLIFIMPPEDKLDDHPRDAARATVDEAISGTQEAIDRSVAWVQANNPISKRKDGNPTTPPSNGGGSP